MKFAAFVAALFAAAVTPAIAAPNPAIAAALAAPFPDKPFRFFSSSSLSITNVVPFHSLRVSLVDFCGSKVFAK
ncbi:UNVERIFIED_CONTAM: hypothetical protein HDU68_003404 [Siphonaria sp. JEL0065]|nr:hypothetical protein HDU68_003404 [Siphonaria sp. JEL0065]